MAVAVVAAVAVAVVAAVAVAVAVAVVWARVNGQPPEPRDAALSLGGSPPRGHVAEVGEGGKVGDGHRAHKEARARRLVLQLPRVSVAPLHGVERRPALT